MTGKIDMSKYKPGQILLATDGQYFIFKKKLAGLNDTYLCDTIDGKHALRFNSAGWSECGTRIKGLIPFESPPEPSAPAEHHSVAWWDNCPWISNRRPDPSIDGSHVLVKIVDYDIDGDDEDDEKRYWVQDLPLVDVDDRPWVHLSHWRPPAPLTPAQIKAQAMGIVQYGKLNPKHCKILEAALALIPDDDLEGNING